MIEKQKRQVDKLRETQLALGASREKVRAITAFLADYGLKWVGDGDDDEDDGDYEGDELDDQHHDGEEARRKRHQGAKKGQAAKSAVVSKMNKDKRAKGVSTTAATSQAVAHAGARKRRGKKQSFWMPQSDGAHGADSVTPQSIDMGELGEGDMSAPQACPDTRVGHGVFKRDAQPETGAVSAEWQDARAIVGPDRRGRYAVDMVRFRAALGVLNEHARENYGKASVAVRAGGGSKGRSGKGGLHRFRADDDSFDPTLAGNAAGFTDAPILPLTLYQDGLLLQQGPFRHFREHANVSFVVDVCDGFFPAEFRDRFPMGVVLNLTDCTGEMYSARAAIVAVERAEAIADAQRKARPFYGRGQRLGTGNGTVKPKPGAIGSTIRKIQRRQRGRCAPQDEHVVPGYDMEAEETRREREGTGTSNAIHRMDHVGKVPQATVGISAEDMLKQLPAYTIRHGQVIPVRSAFLGTMGGVGTLQPVDRQRDQAGVPRVTVLEFTPRVDGTWLVRRVDPASIGNNGASAQRRQQQQQHVSVTVAHGTLCIQHGQRAVRGAADGARPVAPHGAALVTVRVRTNAFMQESHRRRGVCVQVADTAQLQQIQDAVMHLVRRESDQQSHGAESAAGTTRGASQERYEYHRHRLRFHLCGHQRLTQTQGLVKSMRKCIAFDTPSARARPVGQVLTQLGGMAVLHLTQSTT